MLSVKTFPYLVAFAIAYFPPSPSAHPVVTPLRSDNPLSKRLAYANYDRETWCQDQSDEGGKCVCDPADGTLTCDPDSLGAQHAAPRECETPCTCQQLDPGTPDITETGTCSATKQQCNVASDCGPQSCACETFTTPSYGGSYASFSTITKLCGLSSKIKERRALGELIECMCDETYASEECCGDLD